MQATEFDKRASGIASVGSISWGTHFAHFYRNKKELLEVLVPYFRRGLADNEFCVWVVNGPLSTAEAGSALKKAVGGPGQSWKRGQLEIIPTSRWPANKAAAEKMLAAKVGHSLDAGFNGLRFACHAPPHNNRQTGSAVPCCAEAIAGYNAVAAFEYSRDGFDALGLMEVVKQHSFALLKNTGRWETLESSETRRTKAILSRNERKLLSVFGNMSEGFAYHRVILNKNKKPCNYVFLEVNQAFEKLTGLKARNVIGKKVTEVLPGIEDDVTDWIGIYGKVAMTGKSVRFESFNQLLGRWYAVSAFSPFKGYFAAIFSDITTRKESLEQLASSNEELSTANEELSATNEELRVETEERLRIENILKENEKRLLQSQQIAHVGSWELDIKTDLLHWSDETYRIYGLKPQELKPTYKAFLERIHPDDCEAFNTAFRLSLSQKRDTFESEHRIIKRPFNEVRFVYKKCDHIRDKSGKIIRSVGIVQDITERKQAEQEIVLANQRLEMAQKAAAAGFWYWDIPAGKLEWSRELFRLFGLDPDQTKASFEVWRSIIHPDDRIPAEKRIEAALEEHAQLVNEYRVILPTGETRWINAQGNTTYDVQGRPQSMSGICVDVTERRKMQEALQEIEERNKILIESSNSIIMRADKNLNITYINDFGLKFFGYTREELIGRNIVGTTVPEKDDQGWNLAAMVKNLQKNPADYINNVHQNMRKNGERVWVSWTNKVKMDEDGRLLEILAIGNDISLLKKAEEALTETRNYLENLFNYANAPIIVWDRNFNITRFNHAFEKMSGYQAEEVIGKDLGVLFPAESAEESLMKIMRTVSGEHWDTIEIPIRQKNGATRIALWNSANIFDKGGTTVTSTIAQGQDITERKQAEDLLTADNAALTRMHALGGRLLEKSGVQPFLQEIMDSAVAILGAQRGTLQLIEGDALKIVAHHGHKKPFLEFFDHAEKRASVCGEAMKFGQRVIIPDIEESLLFAGTPSLKVLREAGVRAVQSTPMLSRTGKLLGILTTQWEAPYTPGEPDLYRIDLLVRQAADLIEFVAKEKELVENRESMVRVEAIKKEYDRFKDILDKLPVMICLLTPDHNVAFANQSFRAKFGEAKGRRCYEYCFGKTAPCDFCESFDVFKTGRPHHWEVACPDGTIIDAHDFPFTDVDGSPLIMEMDIDITEQRRMQQAMAATQAELERAKRLSDIGVLAATVAHELRNPLAVINMAASNIKRKVANPDIDRHIANIATKVGESDQIINNLLFYSRLKPPHLESIHLHDILEECLESSQKQAKKEITLTGSLAAVKGIRIDADPLQIKEVFNNIINNAQDAVPSEKGLIRMSAEDDGEFVRILVEDNGPGIAKDIVNRIFDPFFTTKAKGTGLGLSVCQQIISMHDGEIGVRQGLVNGTCFYVRLPKKSKLGLDHKLSHPDGTVKTVA